MRAQRLRAYEGPGALELVELEEPDAQGGVLLDVHAIGVNFPDLLATQGLYQYKPALPYVPGCEVAGVVRSAPAGSGWKPGQRAAAFVWEGGYADVVRVPVGALVEVPDTVALTTAAAMVVNYHTVLFALERRGVVLPDETVLVLGASGGIGSAAVHVAKALGARVIAGVANEHRRETARAAGADDAIVLTEGFAEQVRELTGGEGVDVVLDPLGSWIFGEALRALAPEGRILIVGFAAGDIPTLKVNRLLLRNVAAVGVAWGAFLTRDANLMPESGRRLNQMYEQGWVRPQIGARFTFAEIPRALEALREGAIPGKGVVEVVPRERAVR